MHRAAITVMTLMAMACSGPDPDTGDQSPTTATASEIAMQPRSDADRATTATNEPEPPDAAIVVIDDRGEEVRIESTERIIPLDGDLAEIVFALGLGDQVVATDLSATYPAEADAKPEIGYQRALAAEPIMELEPTVLLATDIAGPPETLADLERVGIPLVMVPTPSNSDGPGIKIRAVAEALGVPDTGRLLAEQVDADIAQAIAAASAGRDPASTPPLVAPLYLRGASTQLVLGTEMSIDWMLDALGARNVADVLDVTETEPVNIEALVELGPDVIVATESGLASVGGVDGLLEIPGFSEMPAGEHRRIVAFEDQYLLGNGPRTAELLADLANELDHTEPDTRDDP